jgi:hypothetical protein
MAWICVFREKYAFSWEPFQQLRDHLAVASDQWWNIVWQWCPEELKHDGHLLRVIWGVTFFMSPGIRRIPLATKVIEAAMMNLVKPKIRHMSLMLPEETL